MQSNMSGDVYHNFRKFCSDIVSRKETLCFMSVSLENFDR